MVRLAPLAANDIPTIVGADGGPWWQRDEAHWRGCLVEQSRGDRSVVVASDVSGVVGYGSLVLRSAYPRFREAGIPEIHDVRVAVKARRQGIATAIVGYLEGVAINLGQTAVGIGVGLYADYGPAQRLYAKLGYAPDGFGATYKYDSVTPGSNVTADDDLLLWLTKKLPISAQIT